MTTSRFTANPSARIGRIANAACASVLLSAPLYVAVAPARGAVSNRAHGYTTLTLSPSVKHELRRAHITVTAGAPAKRSGAHYAFALSNGNADPANRELTGTLQGSLVFQHGRHRFTVLSLTERNGKAAWIQAQLGHAGLHTFLKLRLGDLAPTMSSQGPGMTASNMQATISGIAAHTLDVALHTRLFTAGMGVGSATTAVSLGEGTDGGIPIQVLL